LEDTPQALNTNTGTSHNTLWQLKLVLPSTWHKGQMGLCNTCSSLHSISGNASTANIWKTFVDCVL